MGFGPGKIGFGRGAEGGLTGDSRKQEEGNRKAVRTIQVRDKFP